jgi:hypothetical protein
LSFFVVVDFLVRDVDRSVLVLSSSSSSFARGFEDGDGRPPPSALPPRRRLTRDAAVSFGSVRPPPRRRTAVDSDLFGDTLPAAPTNASAAAQQQNLLWGESNDDVTMMVPLLPFRLVLSRVPSLPPSSPSASSSSSSLFVPLVEYLESAWAVAIASDGVFGIRNMLG